MTEKIQYLTAAQIQAETDRYLADRGYVLDDWAARRADRVASRLADAAQSVGQSARADLAACFGEVGTTADAWEAMSDKEKAMVTYACNKLIDENEGATFTRYVTEEYTGPPMFDEHSSPVTHVRKPEVIRLAPIWRNPYEVASRLEPGGRYQPGHVQAMALCRTGTNEVYVGLVELVDGGRSRRGKALIRRRPICFRLEDSWSFDEMDDEATAACSRLIDQWVGALKDMEHGVPPTLAIWAWEGTPEYPVHEQASVTTLSFDPDVLQLVADQRAGGERYRSKGTSPETEPYEVW